MAYFCNQYFSYINVCSPLSKSCTRQGEKCLIPRIIIIEQISLLVVFFSIYESKITV